MQADIAGGRQQRGQRRHRWQATGCGHDHVPVVDQQHDIGSGPPGSPPQLRRGEVRRRQAFLEVGGEGFDGFFECCAVAVDRTRVEQVTIRYRAQEAGAVVGEHEAHLRWTVAGADGPSDGVGDAGLARFGCTEDQQMRILCHRRVGHRQVGFAQPDRDGPPGRVVGVRPGWVRVQLGEVDALGQHSDFGCELGVVAGDLPRGGGDGRDQVLGAVHTVESGHPDHQVVFLHRDRPAGATRGDVAGDPVDLGVVDVAEAELDLGAEVVPYPRLQFRPARRGDDDVHAE